MAETQKTAGSIHMGHRHEQVHVVRQRWDIRGVCALLSLALAGTLLVALSFTPAADAQKREFYGVSPAATLVADDFNRMRNGGVGTLRLGVPWRTVEPSPGVFRFRSTDEVIGNAAARGVRTMPVVVGPPGHVRTPPTRPADRRAFRRLMAALAGRYGRGGTYWQGDYQNQHSGARPRPVAAWQLFNEQNSFHHWKGRATPRAYGRLVKFGARGVRSQNPSAEIVLGGMFATPGGFKKRKSMTSFRYLSRLYRVKGIKRAFDTAAVHPYAGAIKGIRKQMRRIRRVMRKNNDRGARIRVTEIGWGAARGRHRLLKGPKGQARMLRKSFRLLARHRNRRRGWNVAGLNWWSWQDLPADVAGCPFCHSSGLFRGPQNDRKPRPSWRAFRRAAR